MLMLHTLNLLLIITIIIIILPHRHLAWCRFGAYTVSCPVEDGKPCLQVLTFLYEKGKVSLLARLSYTTVNIFE